MNKYLVFMNVKFAGGDPSHQTRVFDDLDTANEFYEKWKDHATVESIHMVNGDLLKTKVWSSSKSILRDENFIGII